MIFWIPWSEDAEAFKEAIQQVETDCGFQLQGFVSSPPAAGAYPRETVERLRPLMGDRDMIWLQIPEGRGPTEVEAYVVPLNTDEMHQNMSVPLAPHWYLEDVSWFVLYCNYSIYRKTYNI